MTGNGVKSRYTCIKMELIVNFRRWSLIITEKQLLLIERLVAGEGMVKDILKDLGIPKSIYYDMR